MSFIFDEIYKLSLGVPAHWTIINTLVYTDQQNIISGTDSNSEYYQIDKILNHTWTQDRSMLNLTRLSDLSNMETPILYKYVQTYWKYITYVWNTLNSLAIVYLLIITSGQWAPFGRGQQGGDGGHGGGRGMNLLKFLPLLLMVGGVNGEITDEEIQHQLNVLYVVVGGIVGFGIIMLIVIIYRHRSEFCLCCLKRNLKNHRKRYERHLQEHQQQQLFTSPTGSPSAPTPTMIKMNPMSNTVYPNL
jgi:hypothetical protein